MSDFPCPWAYILKPARSRLRRVVNCLLVVVCLSSLPGCRTAERSGTPDFGKIVTRPDGLYAGGKRVFLWGANYGGIAFGQNFGTTAWYPEGNGFHMHRATLRSELALMREAGIEAIRIGLLDDGRAVLDETGNVTGLDEGFQRDVGILLEELAASRMRVILVLVDYTIAAPGEVVNGVQVFGREGLFLDEAARSGFVTHFLDPFLTEFGDREAIMAFDIINECHWLIGKGEGGRWDDVADASRRPEQPIPLAALSDFVSRCIRAIRRSPARGKLITLGGAGHLVNRLDIPEIDYIAIHHYGDPNELADMAAGYPDGKPWVLQEFPLVPTEQNVTAVDYVDAARADGASGAFFWNWTPNREDPRTPATVEQRENALRSLRKP